jgi:inosose dehydratase
VNVATGVEPGRQQLFSFGYHLNSWDLVGQRLDAALEFLSAIGFEWFEALVGDSLGERFSREHMTFDNPTPPRDIRDTHMFERFGLFARAQEEFGIRPSSLYVNAEWLNDDVWPHERDLLHTVAAFLRGCEAPVLVCGGGPRARAGSDHAVSEYRLFARRLEEIGAIAVSKDIRLAYHPHLDCFIETGSQLSRLMEEIDPELVGLCIDPAHLVLAGTDPVQVVRDFGDALAYMHFKDSAVDAQTPHGGERYSAFCELGAGSVDFPGIIAVLNDLSYSGVIVIELDVSKKTPEESCRESVTYLREVLGLAVTREVENSAGR